MRAFIKAVKLSKGLVVGLTSDARGVYGECEHQKLSHTRPLGCCRGRPCGVPVIAVAAAVDARRHTDGGVAGRWGRNRTICTRPKGYHNESGFLSSK